MTIIDQPTSADLATTWRTLARLHHNRQLDDEVLDRALATLAAHLPIEDGRDAVAALQDALLKLQQLDDPGFDLATLEAAWQDEEKYAIHLDGLAGDALARLGVHDAD